MEKESFKRWLEKEAEKEGLEIEVCSTKDDYAPRVRKDGVMAIPECWFYKIFTTEEQKALGVHEIAHLKYRHFEKEEKWQDKRFNRLLLLFLIPLLLAVGLSLLGFVGTPFVVVTIGVFFAIIILFLHKASSEYFHLMQLHELEADKYAAGTVGPAPLISSFGKIDLLVEKWRKKGLRWRTIIWWRKKTHPSKGERIEHLKRI